MELKYMTQDRAWKMGNESQPLAENQPEFGENPFHSEDMSDPDVASYAASWDRGFKHAEAE